MKTTFTLPIFLFLALGCKPAEHGPTAADLAAKDQLERQQKSREALMGTPSKQSKTDVNASNALK